MASQTKFTVNGTDVTLVGDTDQMLLHLLREQLSLTGSKIGCGEGQCGVCTVLVDNQPTRSCITPVSAVAGRQIVTIEGLEQNGELHPLQQAFLDVDALQCGYCTAGMIMSGVGLLGERPNPSEEEIVQYMQGNICRCGAYPRIVRAIQQGAAHLRGVTEGVER